MPSSHNGTSLGQIYLALLSFFSLGQAEMLNDGRDGETVM